MNQLRSYTLLIQAITLSPLTHGEGTDTNKQTLRRVEALVPGPGGKMIRKKVPQVSGSAVRGVLRDAAARLDLARYGVDVTSLDMIRLFFKGGKLGGGEGQGGINLRVLNRMCEMFPVLDLFGALDNSGAITGKFIASPLTVYCEELVDAGLQPKFYESQDGEQIQVFPGIVPPPVAITTDTIQYYRHDAQGRLRELIAPEDRRRLEDQASLLTQAKAEGKKGTTDERRSVNESMPHAFEAVIPGVPLIGKWHIQNASPSTFAAFLKVIQTWIGMGAPIGGATAKGHGQLSIRLGGSYSWSLDPSTHPTAAGEIMPLGLSDVDQVRLRAAAMEAELAERYASNAEAARHFLKTGEVKL
jgi:hypothetical protein